MKLLILLATAFAVTGYAMTIKLSDETVLNDVEVTGVSSRGISLLCSDGVRCLLPSEISRNSQEQLAGEIKQYQKLAEQLSQREREKEKHQAVHPPKMGQPQGEKNKNIESGSVISRKKSPWDGFADECNLLRKISRNHPDFAKLEKNLAERIIKLIHTPLPHEFHRNLTQIDEIKKSLMEVYSFLYSREERAKISTLETKFSSILSSMKPEEIIFIVLCFKLEYQMKKRYTCSDNALLYIPKIARLWQPELEKLSITDKQLDRIIEFIDLDNLRRQLVTKRKDPCSPLQYYRGAPLRTYRNSVVSSGQRSISGAAPVSPQQHTSASPREDRCSWGCRGTGWLPGGMRCPEHSGQLSGVIGNPLNSDTIPYCPKCGGSGRITQVIFPSENELISAAFNGQQLTAKQIRRTCPVCGGSGKRY